MKPELKKFSYVIDDELANFGFAALGSSVSVHETANIVFPENITIGSRVRIDPFVTIIASKPIVIGSNVHIGAYSYISAAEPVVLSDFSGLSQGVKIYTASDDYLGRGLTNPTIPEEYTRVKKGGVSLGRHVIIGAGAVVLPGVMIGDGSAVGALSLVKQSLESWGVYSGNPAVCIGQRSQKLLVKEMLYKEFLAG